MTSRHHRRRVADARYNSLRETETRPMMWMPLPQSTIGRVGDLRAPPGAEADVARQARRGTSLGGPYLMVRRRHHPRDQVGNTASRERLLFNLSVVFGRFALLLAAMGLHGTLARIRSRGGRREIGVRLALGAKRSSLVLNCSSVRHSGWPAAAAIIGSRWPGRGFVAAGVSVWRRRLRIPLTVVPRAACCARRCSRASVPAIRASRVDPVMALRSE